MAGTAPVTPAMPSLPTVVAQEVPKVSDTQLVDPGAIIRAIHGHGGTTTMGMLRVLAASEKDAAAAVLAYVWNAETQTVVGDNGPGNVFFLDCDDVFEDGEAAADPLKRHRENKKARV